MQSPLSIPEAIELALHHQEAGRLAEARRIYQQVLQLHPQHPDALHLLGLIEHQQGRHREAMRLISEATRLLPQTAHYHINLGEVCRAANEFTRAEGALREALRLEQGDARAHYNLALVLLEVARAPEAIAELREAVRLSPAYVDARIALATELGRANDVDGAYAAAVEALRIAPNDARALTTAGTAAARMGRPSYGAELLRAALKIDPASATAWTNLATALGDLGLHADAIRAARQAIDAAPDDPKPASMILMTLLRSDGLNAADIASEHRKWGERFAPTVKRSKAPARIQSAKLRIGYVSGDFNAHPVATFLLPVLSAHDRNLIDVTGYATNNKEDAVTERCRSLCDRWRNITWLSDAQAEEQIRADEINILVDLSGHSEHNRLQLFARKPAPLQVTYLGYAATTGVDAIDYRITDELCDPPGMTEHLHTERLVRVSAPFLCYEPSPDAPPVAPLPFDTTGVITFVSCNTPAKITAPALAAWAKILEGVPRSRLVMKHSTFGEEPTRALWASRFAAHGVSAERIEFRPYVAHAEHLSMITQCDIALDPFPYCGTTSTCDALWMGVPVVSLVGDAHASRVGLTLLNSVGLKDLAATTIDNYVTTVLALTNDVQRLRETRARLRPTMTNSALTNGDRLARSIESAYRSIPAMTRLIV